MHAKPTHEVALKEPERFGEEHGARELALHALHHLAPELARQPLGELSVGQRKLTA